MFSESSHTTKHAKKTSALPPTPSAKPTTVWTYYMYARNSGTCAIVHMAIIILFIQRLSQMWNDKIV